MPSALPRRRRAARLLLNASMTAPRDLAEQPAHGHAAPGRLPECTPRGSDHGDRGGRSLARRIPLADCEKPVLFQVGKKARRRRRCSRRSTEMPHAAGKEKAAAGRQPEPRRKRKHPQCIRKLRACQAPLHKVWHRLQSMSAFGTLGFTSSARCDSAITFCPTMTTVEQC